MKDTRQKILDTARTLFNKLGYSQVTIRMIATEMGISSGNLNYHFKKKEQILEALYFEMTGVFDKRVEEVSSQKITLERMKEEIIASMKRMMEYRFFWTDLYFLLSSSPAIKKHFTQVRKGRVAGYQYVMHQLQEAGALQKPTFPREYEFLIQRMLDYSNTWLYASILYPAKGSQSKLIELAAFQLLSLLEPYLTKEGKQQFKLLFPGFISE